MKSFLLNINRYLVIPVLLISTAEAQQILTMNKAVELSMQKNRILQVSSLENQRSGEQIREAWGYLLPNIGFSGQYLHYFQKQVSFLPGNFVGLGENQIASVRVGGTQAVLGTLLLSQPIYNPVYLSGIRSARINEQVSQQEWMATRNNVASDVKNSYLDVLIVQEQEKLQKQSIIRNELALKDSRALMAQGKATRADTLRAYVNLENLKPELQRLTNQVAINKTLLKRIIGLEEQETVELSDSLLLQKNNTETLSFNQNDVHQARPEVVSASLREVLSRELIKKEIAARLPQLSLTGAAIAQTQANDLKVGNYNYPMTSYLGAQLSIPVFSGMRSISRIKQARITELKSKKLLEDVKAQVNTETDIALARLQEAGSRILAQQQVVQAAETSFSITRDRYRQGISSRLDLADAELSLTSSKASYLQAVYDHSVATIALERALGKWSE